jgi:hypothetical protein
MIFLCYGNRGSFLHWDCPELWLIRDTNLLRLTIMSTYLLQLQHSLVQLFVLLQNIIKSWIFLRSAKHLFFLRKRRITTYTINYIINLYLIILISKQTFVVIWTLEPNTPVTLTTGQRMGVDRRCIFLGGSSWISVKGRFRAGFVEQVSAKFPRNFRAWTLRGCAAGQHLPKRPATYKRDTNSPRICTTHPSAVSP